MKIIKALIHSNLYISLAAVSLSLGSQVQLGMRPHWAPYLFLIFFATLFEYNLHRLVTVLSNKAALDSPKHEWVKKNLLAFYLIVGFSVGGFLIAVAFAQWIVLLSLTPIALLTFFYSAPLTGESRGFFRLRQIPYLKIFLISFVWSAVTILLPVIRAHQHFETLHVASMLLERFLFLFAITLPFDIRDMQADRDTNLKTIPLRIGENKSLRLAAILLLLCALLSCFHYSLIQQPALLIAMLLSCAITLFFLLNRKIRQLPFYHYGILDGTMLLQGLLLLAGYFIPSL